MQSPYPIYRHGKACLSKQPPWRAARDPRLARGRSRVRAPGPAGVLRTLFFSTLPSFLPPSGDSFIRTFPTKPTKVLGLWKNCANWDTNGLQSPLNLATLLITMEDGAVASKLNPTLPPPGKCVWKKMLRRTKVNLFFWNRPVFSMLG